MAFVPMNWGIICSINNPDQLKEFEVFGGWMIGQLELAARRLQLGHCFSPSARFILLAKPGSTTEVINCYEKIGQSFPEVSYVIHVLPSKDSVEFELLKERTLNGALIGQGVLAENALNYFKCYQLDEVMSNMNQWIARRLAQITARQSENAKDSYQMLVRNNSTEKHSVEERGSFQPRFGVSQPQKVQEKTNWNNKKYRQNAQDLEGPIGVALHSVEHGNDQQPSPPFRYRQQQEDERDCEVIVKGFPMEFNKFQIASLFADFRPRHICFRTFGEAIVQFANKYHAAQVVKNYNALYFEDENFTLEVLWSAGTKERKTLEDKLNKMREPRHSDE